MLQVKTIFTWVDFLQILLHNIDIRVFSITFIHYLMGNYGIPTIISIGHDNILPTTSVLGNLGNIKKLFFQISTERSPMEIPVGVVSNCIAASWLTRQLTFLPH